MTKTGKNTLKTEGFLDYVNNMQEIDEAIIVSDCKMLDTVLGEGFTGIIKLKTTFNKFEQLTSVFMVEETGKELFVKKTFNIFIDGLWHKQIIYNKCI